MTADTSESATRPVWVSAFLDYGPDDFERGSAFWSQVTGYAASAPRGETGEFHSLLPESGQSPLRVQRLTDGPNRIHLDLHVPDAQAAAEAASAIGATKVREADYVVMTSPGGLTFCFVPQAVGTSVDRPPPHPWPGGTSLVDQVCLDISPSVYDAECAFWADLTGWPLHESPVAEEFRFLVRPAGQPFRFLLQVLGEERDVVTAHLDLSSQDRAAEVARHLDLGATVEAEERLFTVLRDPTGSAYCVTDRDPTTGQLDTRARPALVGDEVSLLRGFLDHHRDTIRLKTTGLSPEQLSTPLPPSDLTLGGMLAHLAYVEDYWFTVILLGGDHGEPWLSADWSDPDWDWKLVETWTPEQLRALFDDSIDRSDVSLEQLLSRGDLDQLSARESQWGEGGHFSLRWVLLHLIEEYARHNGHADLIRQSLDGSTGT